MKAYLDNAATTPLDPAVLEAMLPHLGADFGNPSSIHAFGRSAKTAVEDARVQVAELLGCSPAEILFTSSGTEADNTALFGAVRDLGKKVVISSPLEHHAVLHPLDYLAARGEIELHRLTPDTQGAFDLAELESLLKANPGAVVSLMHGNNEIGNLLDLEAVGALCRQYDALFHTDAVQTVGHYAFDLPALPVDFLAASAHKFHGPKGVGFLYNRDGMLRTPYLHGGAQERNLRGGTENVAGIVGLATALALAYERLAADRAQIEGLKASLKVKLATALPGTTFLGRSGEADSLFTVLNASLPPNKSGDMMLFSLDIAGVAVSGGSACASGSNLGSHVLEALGADPDRPAIRISFSRLTTEEEIDYAVEKIAALYR